MAEVVVSVVAKLAEYLVGPTLQQLKYLFCVGKITRNVEIRKEELILKQGSVQERVQEAINKTERIDAGVNMWKNDVKSLVAEVETLEEQLRANNGCLRGWCPTWRRFSLCRKLAKKTQRMIDLYAKSDFNPFSHPVIAPDVESRTSQNFKFFNSTKMAFDQLWEALQDDGISMIGLWGMGGSGKTTLAREVKKKAEESKLFDRLVFSTISQNPNIENIQDVIAHTLGLKLEKESNEVRAKKLALRLQSEERILIILDDLWAKLNLADIGIPFGRNRQRSCKIVLTTRRLDVCNKMECPKKIQLDLLKEDEAWTLFQTHANVNDAAKEVVAKEIAMECKGLPIAIVAIGICLKGKEIEEMNAMLSRLRNAKLNNVEDEDVRNAFSCLKLSYDYLQTTKAKQLLLMCAMFPEDHNIDFEDLFRYGVGLGLCTDEDSLETARSEVKTSIRYLIDSSLLMRYSPEFNMPAQEYVKLHDLIRDVALWIASEEQRTIWTKELNKLIADESIKYCYAVSSWYESSQFPSQLTAPKLEFLLLRSREPLHLSQASFEGTERLQALVIKCTDSFKPKLQPKSIQHLSNLRTLRLRRWDLCDISFVVSLTRLEILDLRGCKFERVPNGIEKLNKLKLLDLSNCIIDECCYKVIGSCSQLEELYIPVHFPHSENANCYEYLMGPTALIRLRRYKLEIGERGGDFGFHNEAGTRSLQLRKLNISMLGAVIKGLAQRATGIEFYELEGGYTSFMANIVQAVGGMNELTKLHLQRCSKIECIVDETRPYEDAVVPMLDELKLSDMDNLKQLHRGPSPSSVIQKLERLTIFSCPQLPHIFSADCNLSNLKFLYISNCPMLTSLFPVSITCTLNSLEELEIKSCSGLKCLFREKCGEEQPMHYQDFTHVELSLLKCLKISDCPMLTSLLPVSVACTFHSLEELKIESCSGLKHLFGEKCGEEQPMHDQDSTQIELPLLKCLNIYDCPMMTSLLPVFIACTLHSLEELEIESCNGLKHLFGEKGGEEQPMHDQDLTQIELPLLKGLTLKNLPNLVRICSRRYHPKFPSMKTIQWWDCPNMDLQELKGHPLRNEECKPLEAIEMIALDNCGVESIFHYQIGVEEQIPTFQYLNALILTNCARLKFVFSAQICRSLPELTSVSIRCCEELEAIFSGNEETDQTNLSIDESCLLKLKSLEISECNKLKVILSFRISAATSILPQLSTLTTSDSSQMEEIFKCLNIEDHDIAREREIMFPNMERVELKNLSRLVNVCQGFKLSTGEFCRVEVHDCPKLMPIKSAIIDWTEERLFREYGLKFSQLYNNEALDLPLSILNVGQLDAQSVIVEHKWRIIGDDEEEESNSSEMMRSEQQMVGGVIPTQVLSFQYLHSLEVTHCKKLKHLFSKRTIVDNSLPNLTSLGLSNCEELEVIFGDGSEDDANHHDTIVVSSLKMIELTNLPNLKSVCDQGLQIQVALRDITICNCPKFVDSSMGRALQQLGTISLPQVFSNVGTLSNVNEEKGKMLISRVESLRLEDSMNLISVWEGPTFIIFQNLGRLEVSKCRKLKCIFSSPVIRSLPCLETLVIEECEELEEIMSSSSEGEHHFPNESSNNSLCFPQLQYLRVERCRKLKWLFPSLPSSQLHLPQLEFLWISECSQVKGVYNREVEIHEEGSFNNILPRLSFSHIEDCPNFSETTLAALEMSERSLPQPYDPNDYDYDSDSYEDPSCVIM